MLWYLACTIWCINLLSHSLPTHWTSEEKTTSTDTNRGKAGFFFNILFIWHLKQKCILKIICLGIPEVGVWAAWAGRRRRRRMWIKASMVEHVTYWSKINWITNTRLQFKYLSALNKHYEFQLNLEFAYIILGSTFI